MHLMLRAMTAEPMMNAAVWLNRYTSTGSSSSMYWAQVLAVIECAARRRRYAHP